MPKNNPMIDVPTTAVAGDVLAATLSAQAAGMDLLLAEMRALNAVLPGALGQVAPLCVPVGAAEEADFDNMPV